MACLTRIQIFLAAVSMASAPACADMIVHVDGIQNSSADGGNAATVTLSPGSYRLTFSSASNLAFSRFSGNSGCDSNGNNCVQGYETSAIVRFNGQYLFLGSGGGLGPIDPGDGYFATPEAALANSGNYSVTIELTQSATVGIYLGDDNIADNRGGVDVRIAKLGQPETTEYIYDAKGRLKLTVKSVGNKTINSIYMHDNADNRREVVVYTNQN